MISIVELPAEASGPNATYISSQAQFVDLHFEEVFDMTPAHLRGEYQHLERHVEAPWLEAILQQLPKLLPALEAGETAGCLEHLASATCPSDWMVAQRIDILANGFAVMEQFLREVPLLTADEVRSLAPHLGAQEWDNLIQVSYEGQHFYVAEQFTPDGTVILPFLTDARGGEVKRPWSTSASV